MSKQHIANKNHSFYAPTKKEDAMDVTGAGDSYIGALIFSL
ncbi:PfkB family carbohydrate kinase [Peribacillus loiseleuriae]